MFQKVHLLFIFTMGMSLGAVYFAGLWYTVRRLPDAKRPINYLLLSFLMRVSVALAGFGLVMNGQWDQLIAVLGGFFVTREILVRRLGRNIF
jgi:F1F0 ATPase subunit 2